jgi:hypothetical protein
LNPGGKKGRRYGGGSERDVRFQEFERRFRDVEGEAA